MYYDIIIAGFGGQGIMLIGDILAYVAMKEGKEVTWFPSYGVEMRGGNANCTVVISTEKIGSPITGKPHCVIAMNKPSLHKYQKMVKPKGLLIVNTSLVDTADINRNDIEIIKIPANDLASQVGNSKIANMIVLGAFVEKTKIVTNSLVYEVLPQFFSEEKKKLIPMNIEALKKGKEFIAL